MPAVNSSLPLAPSWTWCLGVQTGYTRRDRRLPPRGLVRAGRGGGPGRKVTVSQGRAAGEASTTDCPLAPAQTNTTSREGDPRQENVERYCLVLTSMSESESCATTLHSCHLHPHPFVVSLRTLRDEVIIVTLIQSKRRRSHSDRA
jgi:hypothetical protein